MTIPQIRVVQAASLSSAIRITETILHTSVVAFVQSGQVEPWRIWEREARQVTAVPGYQALVKLRVGDGYRVGLRDALDFIPFPIFYKLYL